MLTPRRERPRLADQGLTGPTTGIEGRRGLIAVAAPQSKLIQANEALGDHWRLSPTILSGEPLANVSSIVNDLFEDTGDLMSLIGIHDTNVVTNPHG